MAEFRVATFEDGFVLYFETPEQRINAYALASTLVALSDAAKAASRALNSAIDVEIVVEALGSGSFKARITALAKSAGLFVPQQLFVPLVIGVLSSYIYEHNFAKKDPIEVITSEDEVVIVRGTDRIVVPRAVHDATQQVAQNPTFVRSIDRMMGSIITDTRVTGFGLAPGIDSPPPALILPRDLLAIRSEQAEPEPPTRTVDEDADLYIVKAIMERSKRKWEFKWHGVTISAPIKDPGFYDDFARHDFTIAPGDEFQVRLTIHQRRDDVSGVYANTGYEVTQVYRHVPNARPRELPLNKE